MACEQKHFRNRNKRNIVKFHVPLGYYTLHELLVNFYFSEWASVKSEPGRTIAKLCPKNHCISLNMLTSSIFESFEIIFTNKIFTIRIIIKHVIF